MKINPKKPNKVKIMGNEKLKTISFFQVVEDKKNNKKNFVRVNSVEVLKLTKHELIVYYENRKLVLTSNYDIMANCYGDDLVCMMFAYKPKNEMYQKLYPLPLANTGFNESMAFDRFEPIDSESIKEKIMEDPEIINLVVEYKSLMDQMKSLLEMSKVLQDKGKEIVKAIIPDTNVKFEPVPMQNVQNVESINATPVQRPVVSAREIPVVSKNDRKINKKFEKWVKG